MLVDRHVSWDAGASEVDDVGGGAEGGGESLVGEAVRTMRGRWGGAGDVVPDSPASI